MKTSFIDTLYLDEVIENLYAIAKGESVFRNSILIKEDVEHAVHGLKECMSYGNLLDFYFLIRNHGMEYCHTVSGINTLVERYAKDNPDVYIQVKRDFEGSNYYSMTIIRK